MCWWIFYAKITSFTIFFFKHHFCKKEKFSLLLKHDDEGGWWLMYTSELNLWELWMLWMRRAWKLDKLYSSIRISSHCVWCENPLKYFWMNRRELFGRNFKTEVDLKILISSINFILYLRNVSCSILKYLVNLSTKSHLLTQASCKFKILLK